MNRKEAFKKVGRLALDFVQQPPNQDILEPLRAAEKDIGVVGQEFQEVGRIIKDDFLGPIEQAAKEAGLSLSNEPGLISQAGGNQPAEKASGAKKGVSREVLWDGPGRDLSGTLGLGVALGVGSRIGNLASQQEKQVVGESSEPTEASSDSESNNRGRGITRRQFLGLAGAAAAGGLGAVLSRCAPSPEETPTPPITPPSPTKKPPLVPTFTPTSEARGGPTPTVVERAIETIPRELGGAESEIFRVSYNGETQQGILNTFPDGEQWFLLGVYPDLPGVEEQVDFANEVVGYDGEVFLTAVPSFREHPHALPFYQKGPLEGYPNGTLLYVENGEVVTQVDPFAHLQEGEVSLRFDSGKGRYEFFDGGGNVTRTEEVFTVPEPTPEPTPTSEEEEPQVYVVQGEIAGYSTPGGPDEGITIYPSPERTFTILDEQEVNGVAYIEIELAQGWVGWIRKDSAYGLVGEVPPPPEAPGIECEAPHFQNRTPDRKTGIVIRDGNTRQEIYPEGIPTPPYYFWFSPRDDWLTRREGKIVEINKETQIITFDLGRGLIVQRRFSLNTQVMLYAHDIHVGMLMEQVIQIGGNLCDLEEGDAAAILHPNEGEGANPSPEGNLWGVLIVQ